MTQNLSLLNHLANGHSVTRVEALVALDIQNITARICDLRDAGVDVKTDVRIDPKGRRYARYFLDHKEVDRLRRLGRLKDAGSGNLVALSI